MTEDGGLGFNFEYDNGTDETFRQSAGTTAVLGAWTHIAVRVLNPIPGVPPDFLGAVNGGVDFFVNGVLQQSFAIGAQHLHDSGSGARFGLFTNFQAYNPFQGAVKDIKITDTLSLDSYIAADAARMNTTAEQILDDDTIFLYRLQDHADAVDQCGRVNLVAQDALSILPTLALTNDTAIVARSKTFNGGGTAQLLTPPGPNEMNMGLATVFRGTCSFDFWLKVFPESGASVDHGFILLNAQGVESQAANFFAIGVTFNSLANGYSFTYQWETGSGSDNSYVTPVNTITYVQMQMSRAVHVGIVKVVTGGSFVWMTYINGVLMDTSSAQTNYDGTMNTATALFTVGAAYSAGFIGGLDEVRISTIVRTGAEFAAIFATATDLAAPVITLVSPANSSTIANNAMLTIDVTDRQGFSALIFETAYDGITRTEVVYDNNDFSSNFQGGSNTKTAINTGFRFTITRDSSWPSIGLNLHVLAVDATGVATEADFEWTVTDPVEESTGGTILSATATSPVHADIVFSVDVDGDPESLLAANYQIRGTGTPDLTVISVSALSTKTVRLVVSEMVDGETYTAVAGNITGIGSGPEFNQAEFEGAGAAPVITLVSPANGSTGVARSHNVVLEITDADSGVDLSTVVVSVEGSTVFTGREFQPGFTGPTSRVIAISHGYRVTIDPIVDFNFGEVVDISVTASDNVGNE